MVLSAVDMCERHSFFPNHYRLELLTSHEGAVPQNGMNEWRWWFNISFRKIGLFWLYLHAVFASSTRESEAESSCFARFMEQLSINFLENLML